jgi:hypothetical protein
LGRLAWNRGKSLTELYGEERAEQIRASSRRQAAATRALLIAEPDRELQRRRHISESMRRFGGYRQGSGRGKKGWYRGYWCDSTYELVYVIFNLDHGIAFSRKTERFAYVFESRKATWMDVRRD